MSDTKFPIVGIGASAGGLDAFHRLFHKLPPDSGMAFVIILHLPLNQKSMLAEIIRHWTAMTVIEAQDGTLIEPNSVYVPLPHTLVALREGCLRVQVPAAGDQRYFHPIDAFFDSLGQARQEQAVGIVLSGTGSDGALGLKAIKASGGLTIAQALMGGTHEFTDMPACAIATGSVDLVAPVDDIPGELMRLHGSPLSRRETPEEQAAAIEKARLQICEVIKLRLGHDFSAYRDKAFLRRVQRRMQMVGAVSPQEYVQRLQASAEEVSALFRDLLISVTSFFRDKDTFEVLATEIIPQLFHNKTDSDTVRIWVPACATGEEVYSLAILLREQLDKLSSRPSVHLFATDLDAAAIATARSGCYPPSLLEGMQEDRLKRFFRPTQTGYVISPEVREMCTFAEHNLLHDPPLSRMDMVSCRNLLIYLSNQAQEALIPIFHYALRQGGILLLGGAESVSRHENLFQPLHKSARIYLRRNVESPPFALSLGLLKEPGSGSSKSRGNRPLGLAVGSDNRGIPPSDKATRWLSRPTDVIEAELVPQAGLASHSVFGRVAAMGRWLVSRTAAFRDLEAKVASHRQDLLSLDGEYKSAVEDLRSANEELQSDNEELEASKEEFQSLNEELNTVNARLSEKIDELAAANSDLHNLFESTGIATIFLDRHLVVRSFTPAVTALYKLIPGDRGRPLTDIVSHFEYSGLEGDVAQVLQSLEPLERRITRDDGACHYIMRILPYRAADDTVSGTLITFIDVSSMVQAETQLKAADVRKDTFIATLSHELRNPLAPIRTAAQLLASPDLEPAHAEQLRGVIARQVLHMSSLLDDLFDLSRINRHSFQLKKADVLWSDVLRDAVETVRAGVDAKRLSLRIMPMEEALTLEVDPLRLTQILSNLLANSVKFTHEGGTVELGYRVEGRSLIFYVRDNGVGVAAARSPHIFDMFAREGGGMMEGEGGLGIGLALVKGLVELHGGTIELNSLGLGHGSTFTVTLPHAVVRPQASKEAHSAPVLAAGLAQRRVLVADDNRDAADTLAAYLRLEGHEVLVAYAGDEALRMAAEHRPDACVLDIGMPGLTGLEVAEHIRREAWGQSMILVAVTGWGQAKDKAIALASDFDHHLTKPIDPSRLNQLVLGAGGAMPASPIRG